MLKYFTKQCPYCEKVFSKKDTDDDVIEDLKTGASQSAIGRLYGITESYVSKIGRENGLRRNAFAHKNRDYYKHKKEGQL